MYKIQSEGCEGIKGPKVPIAKVLKVLRVLNSTRRLHMSNCLSTRSLGNLLEPRVPMLIPPFIFFPGGCAPRTGGRRTISWRIFGDFGIFGDLLGESTGLGRYPFVLSMRFDVECITNHVWGRLGARDMTTFVKRVFFEEVALGDNHG